jgi:beta-hydroxylase
VGEGSPSTENGKMGSLLIGIGITYLVSFSYLYWRCHDHLALSKYLSNHSLLLSPINFVFAILARGGGRQAVFEPSIVPGLGLVKQNYDLIRAEAKALLDGGVFQRPPAADLPGYNSFEKGGWRQYPIKWYSPACRESAASACPHTCSVLEKIPAIRSAMFVVLPPRGRIGRHHDPLATSLRYHIGLVTPNSEKCALTLDGKAYPWQDGRELLFDQTFLHSALNETDQPRVILFCDVENPNLPWGVKHVARGINTMVLAKMTGANDKGKLSWVSAVYRPIYRVRSYVKEQIRPRSIYLYNFIKFSAIGAGLLFVVGTFYLLSSAFAR